MRDYAKVGPQFWIGKTGKQMRGHAEAQIVAMYLMTSPHAEMTGVFYCPLMYIAHETGMSLEGALKGLQRLISIDFCTFDEDSDTVFIHEMAKYQIGVELKVNDNQVKSVKKSFSAMKGIIRSAFFEKYKIAFHLPTLSPSEGPSKPRARTGIGEGAGTGDSDPDGSGGKPPVPVEPKTDDTRPATKTPEEMRKAEIWKAGKALLMDAGEPKDTCGSFLGKLVQDYTDLVVLEAVRAAVMATPADPKEYLKATCQRIAGERKIKTAWWATDESVISKGREMEPPLESIPGESMSAFKARIQAAIDNGGKVPDPKPRLVLDIRDDGPKTAKAIKPEGLDLKGMVKKRQTTA
jgi:hypothetical protein